MLGSYLGGLQCFAIFLSLALLATSSEVLLNSTSISSSLSSMGPPYGNTTTATLASSYSLRYLDSSISPTSLSTSPTGRASISPSITSSGGNLPSSTDSSTSIAVSASFGNGTSISHLPTSTASYVSFINDNGTSASFSRSSTSIPVSIVTTDLVGNGTSLIPMGFSSSILGSGVLSTRTAAVGSGTGSMSSPTGLTNGTSFTAASTTGQNTPSTRYGTGIPSGTTLNDTSTSTTSVSAAGSTPSLRLTIGTFKYLGCASSLSDFATLFLVDSSVNMNLDLCVTECGARQFIYAGVFIERCYCGNSLSSDTIVTPGQGSCNTICPGDVTEFCGGIAAGSKRRFKVRQLRVGNLLSLFAYLAGTANFTGQSSNSKFASTSSSSSSGSGDFTIHSSTGIISSTASLNSNGSVYLTTSSSTSNAPGTAVISGIGSGNSSTLSGSKTSVAGTKTAPFANSTSSFAPSSATVVSFGPSGNFTTASSTPFGNGSSTLSSFSKTPVRSVPLTSSISSIMSIGANFTVTTTYTISSVTHLGASTPTGLPSSSSSTAGLEVSGSFPQGNNSNIISTSATANPTSFVGYTITEIVYTTTSLCPNTINTIISGMPANIVTSSVSTIVLTSTIMIPCRKCLVPSQIITLSRESATSSLSQSLSAEVTNVNKVVVTEIVYTTISTCTITTDTNVLSGLTLYLVTEEISTLTLTTIANIYEVVVTEIVYTTISTCPITISTSVLPGSTLYHVTETVSTLTLTATTTAPCQRCRPSYATVTIMLVGEPVASNLGSTAVASSLHSPLIITSAQSAKISASLSSCASCVNISNENSGEEDVEATSSSASTITSSAVGAQDNAGPTLDDARPITVPAETITSAGFETAGIGATLTSNPINLIYSTQANTQDSTDNAGLNVPSTTGVALTPTPVNHGPYFTGNSEQNFSNFGHTFSLGLVLVTAVLLSML